MGGPAGQTPSLYGQNLSALKARPQRYDVLDPARKGLLLRVTANGTKTFYFRYQRNLKPVRILIGHYPGVSLRLAYEAHADLAKRLNRGEDIRAAPLPGTRSLGVAAEPADPALTVGDLAEEFAKRYLRLERKNPREAELVIQGNIVRYWRKRAAKSITRRDGVVLLDRVVDRGRKVMANRVGALLSQLFTFAVERGMLDASPFAPTWGQRVWCRSSLAEFRRSTQPSMPVSRPARLRRHTADLGEEVSEPCS